jgi:hypothetical protein
MRWIANGGCCWDHLPWTEHGGHEASAVGQQDATALTRSPSEAFGRVDDAEWQLTASAHCEDDFA